MPFSYMRQGKPLPSADSTGGSRKQNMLCRMVGMQTQVVTTDNKDLSVYKLSHQILIFNTCSEINFRYKINTRHLFRRNTCMITPDRQFRRVFHLLMFCVTRTLQHVQFNCFIDLHFIILLFCIIKLWAL